MNKVVSLFDESEIQRFSAFVPLVDPRDLTSHAVTLLLLGFLCVVAFVSYHVVHSTPKSRSLVTEISLASSASIFLGTGTLLAMLGAGLYV
jgi:TRAP-type C4-dicarboxylate transport system permease small subunit